MVRDPYVYLSVARSVLHVLFGLVLGAITGFLFGILVARFRVADAFLSPFSPLHAQRPSFVLFF